MPVNSTIELLMSLNLIWSEQGIKFLKSDNRSLNMDNIEGKYYG